jgi:hypothetical protein
MFGPIREGLRSKLPAGLASGSGPEHSMTSTRSGSFRHEREIVPTDSNSNPWVGRPAFGNHSRDHDGFWAAANASSVPPAVKDSETLRMPLQSKSPFWALWSPASCPSVSLVASQSRGSL